MAFKKLGSFLSFDSQRFFAGKKLVLLSDPKEWKDYDSGEHMGVKVELVILEDKTAYPVKPGESVSNRFEKLIVKVRKDEIGAKPNDVVGLVNPVCAVYGEFRNQLSVTCDDVVKASPAPGPQRP